jgi:hypothetical protein
MFALTVRNGGRDKVAICRWRVLYHIRLLDANGRQLNRDVPVDDYVLPEADQWVVLGFGEAITFLVAAYDKGPRPLRQLPNEARCAECVPVRAAVSPPSFLKDAGVTVARAPRTPRIKLPGPSGTPPARSPQGAAGAADHDQAVFITPRPRSRRSERLRG